MTNHIRPILLGLRNRHFLMLDVVLLALTPWLALLLRVDSVEQAWMYLKPIEIYTLLMLAWKPLVLYLSGIYERYWILASTDSLLALLVGTGAMLAIEIALGFLVVLPSHWIFPTLPRMLPFLSGGISMALVCFTRLAVRLSYERSITGLKRPRVPVLILGAGVAGTGVARELRTNSNLPYQPIGFLDDDRNKQGLIIHGLPVLGPLAALATTIRTYHVQEVIIAFAKASGSVVRVIDQECKLVGVRSKTIPSMLDLLSGTAIITQIRDIQIEDLLRRGVVQTDPVRTIRLFSGKRVMVTGAGGSIGSELCRQIIRLGPSDLILVGHGENSIFAIANELRKHPMVEDDHSKVHIIIADIRDKERIDHVMKRHQPYALFHAAAHKHVGLMEANLQDAVSNNILGTRNLLDLAVKHDTQHFVMISSDKAVNPTSVMGVTKRIAELIVQETALRTNRAFVSVRFGNVLGSRGSVVPIFKAQIAAGGPVIVTHREATRYFMTIPEAVQLVLQAATLGQGGEVYVLDMGKPVKILDLAKDMIRLSGLNEGTDIEIGFTGLARGEKLHEELFYEFEQPEPSEDEKILVCRNHLQRSLERILSGAGILAPETVVPLNNSILRREVERLILMANEGRNEEVIACINHIVPQYGKGQIAWSDGNVDEVPIKRSSDPVTYRAVNAKPKPLTKSEFD